MRKQNGCTPEESYTPSATKPVVLPMQVFQKTTKREMPVKAYGETEGDKGQGRTVKDEGDGYKEEEESADSKGFWREG